MCVEIRTVPTDLSDAITVPTITAADCGPGVSGAAASPVALWDYGPLILPPYVVGDPISTVDINLNGSISNPDANAASNPNVTSPAADLQPLPTRPDGTYKPAPRPWSPPKQFTDRRMVGR